MATYLDALKQTAVMRPQQTVSTTHYKPLTAQIEELMEGLSPLSVNRPWSIAELTPKLAGKHQKRPATRDVAKALTQLGWQRQRCWKKSGLNRRFWLPPESYKNGPKT